MKILVITIILLFGLSKCFAQHDSLPISVTIKVDSEYVKAYSKKGKYIKELIRENDWEVKSDSLKQQFFDISLSIKNTSDTIISIILMTCSWQDHFIANNNYMSILGTGCDHDDPADLKLNPGESKRFKITLAKSMKLSYRCKGCTGGFEVASTKLGLKIVNDIFTGKLSVNYYLAIEDKSIWKIVWSNPLYLLTEDEAHPKPLIFGVYKK
jgi:hypothetical protein